MYEELDEFNGIYFIKNGPIGFLHTKFNNYVYYQVPAGLHVGLEDVIYNYQKTLSGTDQDCTCNGLVKNYLRRGKAGKRRFTAITLKQGVIIFLSHEDLLRMQLDFDRAFALLYSASMK